jgi:hypothetical protein
MHLLQRRQRKRPKATAVVNSTIFSANFNSSTKVSRKFGRKSEDFEEQDYYLSECKAEGNQGQQQQYQQVKIQHVEVQL